MRPILMGVETEYAVSARTPEGSSTTRAELAKRLVAEACGERLRLPASTSGVFLANGGHLYIDCGAHPEFATPECTDPWELLRYIRAGERMLARAATSLESSSPTFSRVRVYRSNVDYTKPGTTWGCHESYLYRCGPAFMSSQLIPHLVSRVIYAGAGGFHPLTGGHSFTLSPRAWLLGRVVSDSSTGERGIFHTRDEPLSDGPWRRLHLIVGESLCSDYGTVLKLGATALIVATIDAARKLGESVRLENPVTALHRFAGDPRCTTGAKLAGGGRATALEIQRRYLEGVERYRANGLLPAWSGEICRMWGETLDRLERDPESLGRTLDWAIKRALYRDWRGDGPDGGRPGARLGRALRKRATRLRLQLLEADVRFGELGGSGIFDLMDRGGHLEHCLVEDEEIERALHEPPSRGRARLRGDRVRSLGSPNSLNRYLCGWTTIVDRVQNRYIDLSNPFAAEAEWRPGTPL